MLVNTCYSTIWLRIGVLLLVCCALATTEALAQQRDIAFPKEGAVRPRSALEIEASNWSVGAETMDRDYTIYENWREYLGPLGVKKARVQTGWAKTEKKPGVYNWSWLDAIVFDMAEQGVEPWLSLSYGNPNYAGGGGTMLHAAAPTSEEALAAWEQYVRGIVARYKDVVDEWEVWNEPNSRISPVDYTRLLIRTAEAVRALQPNGKILAMALGSVVDYEFADSVLSRVAARDKLHLIDQVTFHRHRFDPENYEPVVELRKVVRQYAPHITIRQGESGAPSERRETKALSNYDWTELTQAKYNLRRMLNDLGRDIPTSIFGIMDMKYPDEMNVKGLLKSREDQTVAYAKPAYSAVQHVTAIFDNELQRIPRYAFSASTDSSISVFGYEERHSGEQVVTAWFNNGTPKDSNTKKPVDFTFYGGEFSDPVYVDLRTGEVYDIPKDHWSQKGSVYEFRNVPIYDSPILVADRSVIPLQK